MPKISATTQIASLGLPAHLNKMIRNKGMYTIRSLQEKTEAELRKIYSPAQLTTIISAMSEHGIRPRRHAPMEHATIPEIKTITLPVGGNSDLGKQVLALMKASGVVATTRLTKRYRIKISLTLENALAAYKMKAKRPQSKKEPANRPDHALK